MLKHFNAKFRELEQHFWLGGNGKADWKVNTKQYSQAAILKLIGFIWLSKAPVLILDNVYEN